MSREIRTYSKDEPLVAERRRQIVDTSARVFIKRGYDRTNLTELASAFGMSKGALYHYIGSKEDILYLVIEFASTWTREGLAKLRRSIAGLTPTEGLRHSLENYFRDLDGMQDMFNLINHVMPNLDEDSRRVIYKSEGQIVGFFEDLLKAGVQKGEFKVNSPRLVAHNIVCLGNAWANRRWYLRKRFTLERYIKEQSRSLLRSICVK